VRILAGVAGALLVALMLSEFFVTFMLPRRVRRDPRIAGSTGCCGYRGGRPPGS
jgi:hypothetical protein